MFVYTLQQGMPTLHFICMDLCSAPYVANASFAFWNFLEFFSQMFSICIWLNLRYETHSCGELTVHEII